MKLIDKLAEEAANTPPMFGNGLLGIQLFKQGFRAAQAIAIERVKDTCMCMEDNGEPCCGEGVLYQLETMHNIES